MRGELIERNQHILRRYHILVFVFLNYTVIEKGSVARITQFELKCIGVFLNRISDHPTTHSMNFFHF